MKLDWSLLISWLLRIHYAILPTLGCLKFYIKRVKGKLAVSNENLAKAKKENIWKESWW